MPKDLRTVPREAIIDPQDESIIDMGLRHHLHNYVSQEDGDGKPTAYRVAKDAQISPNTIYKLTADAEQPMSWTIIGKLCSALNIQPGELLSYEDDG